jgi:hypothetical protein
MDKLDAVDYSTDLKYRQLIEKEIQTGFAAVREATSHSCKEEGKDALADARKAYYNAANFLLRVQRGKILDLRRRLRELGAAINLVKGIQNVVPASNPRGGG